MATGPMVFLLEQSPKERGLFPVGDASAVKDNHRDPFPQLGAFYLMYVRAQMLHSSQKWVSP